MKTKRQSGCIGTGLPSLRRDFRWGLKLFEIHDFTVAACYRGDER